MVLNRRERRSAYTDQVRLSLLEEDMDFEETSRKDGISALRVEMKEELLEIKQDQQRGRDEIDKSKWWFIGIVGGVAVNILMLALQLIGK